MIHDRPSPTATTPAGRTGPAPAPQDWPLECRRRPAVAMDEGELADMAKQRRRGAKDFDPALTYFKLHKTT